MFLAVVVSLLLFCAGMGSLLAVYLCLVWCVSLHGRPRQQPLEGNDKLPKQQGLSEAQLRRLPTVECGKEEEKRTPSCGGGEGECVVCLELIRIGDRCRLIPACSHAFHIQCVDEWLTKRSVCPICRSNAACESGEKNGVNGGAAAALQEEEGRDHDQESRRRPPPPTESVVVDMPIPMVEDATATATVSGCGYVH